MKMLRSHTRADLALVSHRSRHTREFLKSLTLFEFYQLQFHSARYRQMNKAPVKLIKRHERIFRRPSIVKLVTGPNRWSRAVRSWVVDFQERDRTETLPAFDSLFKDDLPHPENIE